MEMQSLSSQYRVEVSGWDVAESFFVEKATLELSQQGDRIVHLRRPVREGLLLFLRLIDSRLSFPALPVAYRIVHVDSVPNQLECRVALRKLQHRSPGEEELPAADAASASSDAV
jgi:hypothetical protein